MFTVSIICIIALLILSIYSVFDLHDSVVILKSVNPDAEISRTAQLAYTTVQRFKK